MRGNLKETRWHSSHTTEDKNLASGAMGRGFMQGWREEHILFEHQIKSSPCTDHGIHHIPYWLWTSQMSGLPLKSTRSSPADKSILIKEPVCTCGLKSVPAGVASPRTTLPRIRNTRAEAESQSQIALMPWHLPGLGTQAPPHHQHPSQLTCRLPAGQPCFRWRLPFLVGWTDDLPANAEVVRGYFLISYCCHQDNI